MREREFRGGQKREGKERSKNEETLVAHNSFCSYVTTENVTCFLLFESGWLGLASVKNFLRHISVEKLTSLWLFLLLC